MDSIKLFEQFLGGWWAGVRFHRGKIPDGKLAKHPMRFCEAIAKSRNGPIILTEELASCPGSRRSFGWSNDDALEKSIAQKEGMDFDCAHNIVMSTAHLDESIIAIEVGTYDNPDVIVSFEQPESAMRLVNLWQRSHGEALKTDISTFMSVCGSVAVRAYLTGQICLSFGCSESRDFGKISRDRLVVGVPLHTVKELVSSIRDQHNHEPAAERVGIQPEAWL